MKCIKCGSIYQADPWMFFCPRCGSLLEVTMPPNISFSWIEARSRRFGVWRYIELLPLRNNIEPVTMCEGGTPLVKISRITQSQGAYVKLEGSNPTGSFKDRGMTIGLTIAKYIGVEGVVVASTGNTSASAAAYAARAGLKCVVVLPRGNVAKGKLAQALLYGAEILEVEGVFDNALERVLSDYVLKQKRNMYPLNSYNPWRLEGQKTIAFEIVDELGESPDFVIVPVGNAGNISAIWKGFKELYNYGLTSKLPRMIGVQAEKASPLVATWRSKTPYLIEVDDPSTVATAIKIGKPVNWLKAIRAVEESKGEFIAVSDNEILRAMRDLGRYEGVGLEPASATTLAGYKRALDEGIIRKDDVVVLIGTGNVLKDPDAVIAAINESKT